MISLRAKRVADVNLRVKHQPISVGRAGVGVLGPVEDGADKGDQAGRVVSHDERVHGV